MKTIERLSPSVINRIAAGEIIHYPCNAVKELIENSLDAKASYIQIFIDNSMQSIQIIDNGCGIKVDDMPLVCERYATSKLKQFNDLLKLETFGFRGEALASISQIAKVIIASKPKDNTYGYQATYQDGKLLGKPKLCASSNGTRITIRNLFENMPIRKKALRSNQVERHNILEVVKKYAIHNSSVQFILKREKNTEISSQKASSQLDRIQQIYGTRISTSLKSTEYIDSKCGFKLFFSELNEPLNSKNTNIFILFVNDRLVENNSIKKEMKQAYNNISNGFKPPFIYISLKVDPSHVDVNIHPTKNEIYLLNEKDIIDKMITTLKSSLSSFIPKKQTKQSNCLPEKSTLDYYFKKPTNNTSVSTETDSSGINTPPLSIKKGQINYYFKNTKNSIVNENPMIQKSPKKIFSQKNKPLQSIDINRAQEIKKANTTIKKSSGDVYLKKLNSIASIIHQKSSDEDPGNLDSIITIKSEIKQAEDKNLSNILMKSQCISIIDDILAFIVYKDCFYLINYNTISEEYFYQVTIYQIGKFGKLMLSTPISIKSCISLFVPNVTRKELNLMAQSIVHHKELLKSYYCIEVSDEEDVKLICLPMIISNYVPSIDKLPVFLHNLATQIEWDNEIECLDAIAREISSFYCCCIKTQFNYFFKSTREFKAPKYLIEKGHITELKIPDKML